MSVDAEIDELLSDHETFPETSMFAMCKWDHCPETYDDPSKLALHLRIGESRSSEPAPFTRTELSALTDTQTTSTRTKTWFASGRDAAEQDRSRTPVTRSSRIVGHTLAIGRTCACSLVRLLLCSELWVQSLTPRLQQDVHPVRRSQQTSADSPRPRRRSSAAGRHAQLVDLQTTTHRTFACTLR